MCLVAFARLTIERKFSDIASRIVRAYIAHISKTFAHVYIRIVHLSNHAVLVDYVQRYSIQEICAVGSFDDA